MPGSAITPTPSESHGRLKRMSFIGYPFIDYDVIPKFNDLGFEFKANVEFMNISDVLLKAVVEKWVYPKFLTLRLPGARKEKGGPQTAGPTAENLTGQQLGVPAPGSPANETIKDTKLNRSATKDTKTSQSVITSASVLDSTAKTELIGSPEKTSEWQSTIVKSQVVPTSPLPKGKQSSPNC